MHLLQGQSGTTGEGAGLLNVLCNVTSEAADETFQVFFPFTSGFINPSSGDYGALWTIQRSQKSKEVSTSSAGTDERGPSSEHWDRARFAIRVREAMSTWQETTKKKKAAPWMWNLQGFIINTQHFILFIMYKEKE